MRLHKRRRDRQVQWNNGAARIYKFKGRGPPALAGGGMPFFLFDFSVDSP
jgi:hypothetical protein